MFKSACRISSRENVYPADCEVQVMLILVLVRREGLLLEDAKNPEQLDKKFIVYQSFTPRYFVIEGGFASSDGTRVLIF